MEQTKKLKMNDGFIEVFVPAQGKMGGIVMTKCFLKEDSIEFYMEDLASANGEEYIQAATRGGITVFIKPADHRLFTLNLIGT